MKNIKNDASDVSVLLTTNKKSTLTPTNIKSTKNNTTVKNQ